MEQRAGVVLLSNDLLDQRGFAGARGAKKNSKGRSTSEYVGQSIDFCFPVVEGGVVTASEHFDF